MISLKINGKTHDHIKLGRKTSTVLDILNKFRVDIPNTCTSPHFKSKGMLHLCHVNIAGHTRPQLACQTKLEPDMIIDTTSSNLDTTRKKILQNILNKRSIAHTDSLILRLAKKYDLAITFKKRRATAKKDLAISLSKSPSIDPSLSIAACRDLQSIDALSMITVDGQNYITTPFEKDLKSSGCVSCGQCLKHNIDGSIIEREDMWLVADVMNWLHVLSSPDNPLQKRYEKSEHVTTSTCLLDTTAIHILTQHLHCTSQQLSLALEKLGFDNIHDTRVEEQQYIEREELQKRDLLISGFCPSVVRFISSQYPELLAHVNIDKLPWWYVSNNNLDEESYIVAITACTPIKEEDLENIDAILSVREILKVLALEDIAPSKLIGDPYHNLQKDPGDLDPMTTGLANVRKVLEQIQSGDSEGYFQLLACPGGCHNGGGAPLDNS